MGTPDILKEAKLKMFLSLGAAIPLILYSVGRWYKEWYFAQFHVHYGMFRFDIPYYMYGAWATMLVAVTSVAIMLNAWLRFSLPSTLVARVLAIGLCVLTLLRVLLLRLDFAPDQLFPKKLLTSADLSIACLGMAAFVHGVLNRNIREWFSRTFTVLLKDSPLVWWIGLFVFWIYCVGVGYALGTYHGQKAIWEGKMGLQWVTVKAEARRWILVEQADDVRVFIYDRDRKVSRLVKRDDIKEMQERVRP